MSARERIFVTGGHGFVGSHLLPKLRTAFPAAELLAPAAKAFDVTDQNAVEREVAAFRPTVCIHLAAVSAIPQARRDPEAAWRVNLLGTVALAASMLRHSPDGWLIYPSSADAYGRSFKTGVALSETAALAPMNIYGATKGAAELALGAMVSDGLRVVVFRPFNHTGTGQTAQFAVPAFARQIARIEGGLQDHRIEVGAVEPMRDFLDVRDVCDAYVAAAGRRDAITPGTVCNIASGIPRRIGSVLERMIELAGVTAHVETTPGLLRPIEIASASGNTSLVRVLLDWSPKIAWDTTLTDVINDWRERVRQNPQA